MARGGDTTRGGRETAGGRLGPATKQKEWRLDTDEGLPVRAKPLDGVSVAGRLR